ncbi:MAG: hypothetical protein MUP81_05790 [Dehalococcoidia bacterium]|nr:hypothetical protein [Dehalococcoidia bacterium]
MLEGSWITVTMADQETTSEAINLGKVFEKAVVILPVLTSCRITMQGAMTTGGTYQNVYMHDSDGNMHKVWTAESEGEFNWVAPLGGFQFLKLYSYPHQEAARTFYVMGVRS